MIVVVVPQTSTMTLLIISNRICCILSYFNLVRIPKNKSLYKILLSKEPPPRALETYIGMCSLGCRGWSEFLNSHIHKQALRRSCRLQRQNFVWPVLRCRTFLEIKPYKFQ